MPFQCSVPYCRGNYNRENRVSVFRFPKDPELSREWTRLIMRKDFTPTKSSRVCERHFKNEDFVKEVSAYDSQRNKWITAPLDVSRLKNNAVPSILLPNCVSNLRRTTTKSKGTPEEKVNLKELACIAKSVDENIEFSWNIFYQQRIPGEGYICKICNKGGHYIKDCPETALKKEGPTPYQGPLKCFGRFQCPKCKRKWLSSQSFANMGQRCSKCNIFTYPYKQMPQIIPKSSDDDSQVDTEGDTDRE